MDLELVYDEVNKRIDMIDFPILFPEFHKFDFAVYNDAFFILNGIKEPVLKNFIGNTAIEFRGKLIAIWNMTYEEAIIDFDVLTSNLVHEMFHCFQKEQGEARFPDDLVLLDYPDNLENYGLKLRENLFLVKSLNEKSKLFDFVSIRKKREEFIGEIIEQEFKVETIEGLAEYVGTLSLKQLSIKKYQHRVDEYKKILLSRNEMQFAIRKISYYIGTIFYLVMDKHRIDFSCDLSDSNLFMRKIELTGCNKNIDFTPIDCRESFNNYVNNKRELISNFLSNQVEKFDFEASIVGYDPMNMIKVDNQILCRHFIMLEKDNDVKMIQEPCLLNMKKNESKNIDSYYINKKQSYI